MLVYQAVRRRRSVAAAVSANRDTVVGSGIEMVGGLDVPPVELFAGGSGVTSILNVKGSSAGSPDGSSDGLIGGVVSAWKFSMRMSQSVSGSARGLSGEPTMSVSRSLRDGSKVRMTERSD